MFVPTVKTLYGGGSLPGAFAINFDPSVTANQGLLKGLKAGSILQQYGEVDSNCEEDCAAAVWVLGCTTCDGPVVVEKLFPAAPPAPAPPPAADGPVVAGQEVNVVIPASKKVSSK